MSPRFSFIIEISFQVIANSHSPEKLLQTLFSVVLIFNKIFFKFSKYKANGNAQLSATDIQLSFLLITKNYLL